MSERTDWTGRVLRVRVDGPAHGGEFVARHEGRVVFCRGGLTGELVDVVVDDDPGRAFCRGTVREVLEASGDRVAPTCPAAAAGAGCCDWSHVAPAAARGFAGRVLADQVRRIGRVDLPAETVPVEVPAGDDAASGWRTVARWVTDPGGRVGVRRARSRELVTEPCTQADARITESVAAADVGPRREVLGVLGDDGVVHVAARPLAEPPARGASRGARRTAATRARARHARAGRWRVVAGPDVVVRRVGDRTWELPVDAFWQAHRSAAGHYSELVRAAVASAAVPAEPVVWDLYGGAGLFAGAALDAAPGARVTIVESAEDSLGAAARALGGGDRVRTVGARVERFLDDGGSHGAAPDVVVLDPPRGGAGVDVMTRIGALRPSRIVHVGCDPASLARDVGVLVSSGWRLADLRGVAAFPGTHHVEGLAVLDAPPSG